MDYGEGGSYSVTMDGPFGNTEDTVRIVEISAPADKWKGGESPFSMTVDVEGVNVFSKVDIQLSVEQMQIFHDQVIAFTTVNTDGVVTLYAVGDKPRYDCTFQATMTNVDAGENTTITGNTVSTTQTRPDYAQTDETNAGYIRNKPDAAIKKAQTTADAAAKTAGAALPKSGGTMTGALDMGGNKITGLPEPSADSDAATKKFTETYVSGKRKAVAVTLSAAGWADKLQTATVDGVTADETKTDVIASAGTADENFEAYNDAGIRLYAQGDGSVTFKCSDVPKADIVVNVMVLM